MRRNIMHIEAMRNDKDEHTKDNCNEDDHNKTYIITLHCGKIHHW